MKKIITYTSSLFSLLVMAAFLFEREMKLYFCEIASNIQCSTALNYLASSLFIFLPIAIFSIVLRNKESYNLWVVFSLLSILLSVLIVGFVPEYTGDEFFNIQMTQVLLLYIGVYTLISLGLAIFSKKTNV